ncbi:ATP-binding protein [Candidatus Contubernalis alkaliaceticus]|uniref:ATP-binding protein n=1 Tax=Candidatus Contubernalis alkaliaceticus TaxID=338645 RepID=UPI001F4C3EE3|nr:ATP-binding protein [Candidatus Contubernalis alkalaceticus]UNC93061.1 ATP-binding protein [Candidatus Contubernalis alkalaceticus]
MKNKKNTYPFCAIVGQEQMKKALILNIINPALGGVLIRGEKGTAKSTAVRALADLLPEMKVIEDCVFGCDPREKSTMCQSCLERSKKGETLPESTRKMMVIDLPVSATEDRVVGTLDIEHAIKKGEKKFEPGILAKANRSILYVDEVNLLDDHVVDVLLDSAAMGVNTIEREGVSYCHPANFVLVGTMNPEEGDLRPQLLDRFGLAVDVRGEGETKQRVEVIKRRLDYEKNPSEFDLKYKKEQSELGEQILKARENLKKVVFSDQILELSARISIEMGVDGHRADINMIKTALTIAAFNDQREITAEHLLEASALVLPHRMRRRPFEDGMLEFSKVEGIVKDYQERSIA